jgi:hydrogenase small subunit
MTPFYKRIPDIVIPGVGVESSANVLGAAVVAASVGGVAVHATATVIAKQRKRKVKPESLPLAVLGETEKDTEETKKDQR